eukprot:2825870-Amphidinium_carterae.1
MPKKDRPSAVMYKKHAEVGTQASQGADAPDPSSYELTRVSDTLKDSTQSEATIRSVLRRYVSQMVARIC